MNIEDVIRAWKADENDQNTNSATNPIGEELTDQELLEATGGRCVDLFFTCNNMFTCATGTPQTIQ
jgi:hypothetical protein